MDSSRDRKWEFIRKFAKAKEMEAEAFMELLPESSREHMSIIGREAAAMGREGMAGVMHGKEDNAAKNEAGSGRKTVKKVEIG